jgi:hypothetical protein
MVRVVVVTDVVDGLESAELSVLGRGEVEFDPAVLLQPALAPLPHDVNSPLYLGVNCFVLGWPLDALNRARDARRVQRFGLNVFFPQVLE